MDFFLPDGVYPPTIKELCESYQPVNILYGAILSLRLTLELIRSDFTGKLRRNAHF